MSEHISASDFLKTAARTAEHFGFQSLERVKEHEGCKVASDRVDYRASAVDRRNDALHGMLTAGMCHYFDHKMNGITGPVLFYAAEQVPRSGETALSLQIFNVEKSIAEVILIETIRSILSDIGSTNYRIRVNSLGDRESVTRYIREITNFLRKRIDEMPASARELMKEHVFIALMHLIERNHELAERTPNPMEYLSDISRKHFREIIEYLDISRANYEIDPKLIGHHECYSDALFAFDMNDGEGNPLAESPFYIRGGRYDAFINRMSKTRTPAAGAVVVLRNKKAPQRFSLPLHRKKPSVFIAQLGFGPKIKSLMLLNLLKDAHISVLQDITSDSISEQLRHAERESVRYAVIVGQKEYIEDNVIVRDLFARSQETVAIRKLPGYLRRVAG